MLRKLLLLIIIACTIISCQKDFVIEDDIEPPTTNDSTLLERYIEVDTTSAIPDTNSFTTYRYDAQKRMTNLHWKFEFISPGVYGSDFNLTFYYNGSDTMPNKIISVYTSNYGGGFPEVSNDTSYLFFNASGLRIKDSTVTGDSEGNYYISVNTFTHNANIIYSRYTQDYIIGGPGASEELDTFYITKLNGNVVSQIDTTSSPFGDYYVSNFSFSYDDKINPFSHSHKMFNLWPIMEFEMSLQEIYQKNNPISIINTGKDQVGNDESFGRKFNYIYKSNNLPASVTIKNYDPGTGNESYRAKGIFYYTR